MPKIESFPRSVLRRFEFMEWRLFWESRLGRRGLEKVFGISTPQASVDLRNYQLVAPRNMVYDGSEKAYVPTIRFTPKVLALSADRLLLQLRAYLMGAIPGDELWFETIPAVDGAPDIVRSIDPEALRQILTAMRRRRKIEIEYQSLTSSRLRYIAPHSLAFDGHRWHVRALCCENDDFRDFVITRITRFGASMSIDFDPSDDVEWNTKIALRLAPHPGLTDEQRRAIERDYGMTDGKLTIEVRLALSFYFIMRLNLDLERQVGVGKLKPQRIQIVLENLDEVEEALAQAKLESAAQVRVRKAVRAMEGGASKPSDETTAT